MERYSIPELVSRGIALPKMSQINLVKEKPVTVFHLTHRVNRKSILKHGLIPSDANGTFIKYENRIYVSSTQESKYGYATDFVGSENIDVLRFEVTEDILNPDKFSGHKNHFYINESVSPENLVLHETF